MTHLSLALDGGSESVGTSAATKADLAARAAQRAAATWTMACNARSAADFLGLCEAAGLDTGRKALSAVLNANRRPR